MRDVFRMPDGQELEMHYTQAVLVWAVHSAHAQHCQSIRIENDPENEIITIQTVSPWQSDEEYEPKMRLVMTSDGQVFHLGKREAPSARPGEKRIVYLLREAETARMSTAPLNNRLNSLMAEGDMEGHFCDLVTEAATRICAFWPRPAEEFEDEEDVGDVFGVE